MTQLIFDAGLETERSFECDNVFEKPMLNRLNAQKMVDVSHGGEFPELDDFKNNPDFTTVSLVDGDVTIPLIGSYDVITDVSVSYFAADRQYSATIILGKKA